MIDVQKSLTKIANKKKGSMHMHILYELQIFYTYLKMASLPVKDSLCDTFTYTRNIRISLTWAE